MEAQIGCFLSAEFGHAKRRRVGTGVRGENMEWRPSPESIIASEVQQFHSPDTRLTESSMMQKSNMNMVSKASALERCIDSAGGFRGKHKLRDVTVVIRWRCPDKFIFEPSWLVAEGDKSVEAIQQKQRETVGSKVLYSCWTLIPDSPLEPQENCKDVDDSLIFQIPVTPEEDLDANVEKVIENTRQASLPDDVAATGDEVIKETTETNVPDLLKSHSFKDPDVILQAFCKGNTKLSQGADMEILTTLDLLKPHSFEEPDVVYYNSKLHQDADGEIAARLDPLKSHSVKEPAAVLPASNKESPELYEDVNVEIATAVAAACVLVNSLEGCDLVDYDLLIALLRNPALLESLAQSHKGANFGIQKCPSIRPDEFIGQFRGNSGFSLAPEENRLSITVPSSKTHNHGWFPTNLEKLKMGQI